MADTLFRRYYAFRHGRRVFAGFATPQMVEAIADPATDRCVVIDAAEKVITLDNMDAADVVRPLRDVRIEAVETARAFDGLAARYRKALVLGMHADRPSKLAALLDEVTVMDPADDELARQVHADAADEDSRIASAMRYLPRVWGRTADHEELTKRVTELENEYLPAVELVDDSRRVHPWFSRRLR